MHQSHTVVCVCLTLTILMPAITLFTKEHLDIQKEKCYVGNVGELWKLNKRLINVSCREKVGIAAILVLFCIQVVLT